MATFLLVHGAWHGGWCWTALSRELATLGHRCVAPTLTGLGERSHLLSRDITVDTHVMDVLNLIRWRDLHDVVLVGHSYGGMVITGAAGQSPERISSMVYLDAIVPQESNVSLFARSNPERMASFQRQIDAGAIGLEPDYFDAWSDDPATIDWLKSMCTPQPVGTFQSSVTLTGRETEIARKYYILCARNRPSAFWDEYDKTLSRPGWSHDQIQCKHDAMIEAPGELAGMLHRFVSA